MQQAPWTPPTCDLPKDVVGATEILFKQGLADPRGCEYREISVTVGSVWSGEGAAVECHGWVLPEGGKGTQRLAVGWNGLVYATLSVGEKANLDTDIRAMIKADEESKAAWIRDRPEAPFRRFGAGALSEGRSVSEASMMPIKVCILLRLGRGDLAASVWKSLLDPEQDAAVVGQQSYLEFAGAYLWSMFDRAVCAHMRADDHVAIQALRELIPFRKAIEREALAEKLPFDMGKIFSYLDIVPTLLADQERRAIRPPRKPALEKGKKAFPSHAAWIAALIEDLDSVHAQQHSQPGRIILMESPVVAELASCGDDAVEPLLNCLEHDIRLTRSVHFWRDFSQSRSPIGVSEAAYVALSSILQTSFFDPDSTGDDLTSHGAEGRKKMAAAMRAHWNKYKGTSQADRWFAILADDTARADEWVQAMASIARPVDVQASPGFELVGGSITTPMREGRQRPKLNGESLRAKRNPSLADLVAKRIPQVDQAGDQGLMRGRNALLACNMALQLHDIDASGSAPAVRAQLDYCIQNLGGSNDYDVYRKIAALAVALADSGDPSGLKTYGNWVRTTAPNKVGPHSEQVLSPLWRLQDDPAMTATADWLFGDEASPWNAFSKNAVPGLNLDSYAGTPLLGVGSFRAMVVRELANTTVCATLKIDGGGIREETPQGGSNGYPAPLSDPNLPPSGTQLPIRICDRYAVAVADCSGAPDFQLYWLQPKRDAAIQTCAEFLKRYGQRLQYDGRFRFDDGFRYDDPFEYGDANEFLGAHLIFPSLDRCAAPEDVGRLAAIFSLKGQGEHRQFKLPVIPEKARWTTLKKYPFDGPEQDSTTGEVKWVKSYHQDCWVWQAEELKTAAGWQRFYGVVGPHEIAKVPAAEIEAPGGWPWQPLSNGVDCRVDLPGLAALGADIQPAAIDVKSPLILRISLRNRLGVAQPLPEHLLAKNADGQLAIRRGLQLQLRLIPSGGRESPFDPRAWTSIPMKKLPTLGEDLAASRKPLETAESVTVAEFDLRDCFEALRPGNYVLQIKFTGERGFAEGETSPVLLPIGAKAP